MLNNNGNLSFDSDVGGPMRKSNSNISLASSAYIGGWVVLDILGKEFRASKISLARDPTSYLARIVDEDVDPDQLFTDSGGLISFNPDSSNGRWQLDANPDYFEYILKYLRIGKINGVKPGHSWEDLLDEAELLKLTKLADICRQKIHEKNVMQQRSLSTSTSPSNTSLYGGIGGGSSATTPSSSIHHFQPYGPPPPMFCPPGFFPHPPQMGQPPPLYSQPPPGFEQFTINNSIPSPPIQHQQFSQHRMNSSFGGRGGGIMGIPPNFQENILQQPTSQVSSASASISNSSIGTLIDDNNSNIQQQQMNLNRGGNNLGGGLPRLDELPMDEEQLRGLSAFEMNNENGNNFVEENIDNENIVENGGNIFEEDLGMMNDCEERNEKTNNNDIGLPQTPEVENDVTIPHVINQSTTIWDDLEQEEEEIKETIDVEQLENDEKKDINNFNECGISSTVFEPPSQKSKIVDTSEDTFHDRRVPAFELSTDGRILNYSKILSIRKRHTQEFLKFLSQADKPLELAYASKFGVDLGCVLFYLQRLASLYPKGCDIKQYCDFELFMKSARQSENNHYFNNTIPSVVLLLQSGDLLKFDEKGMLSVAEPVCKVRLLCLRQNLCSNLFRFLIRRKHLQYSATVELLLNEMKSMVPSNVESPPDARCLLSICNKYPAVFELVCKESENFNFYRASVALNESIVKKDENLYWRVVLDCEYANIINFEFNEENNNYGCSFCDCENCQSLTKENYFGGEGGGVSCSA
uniref:BTB domain-containing protein n=1 Tax=Meloidogyne incognita TaxID=6306 RepID=A0A914MTQ8_MELIC